MSQAFWADHFLPQFHICFWGCECPLHLPVSGWINDSNIGGVEYLIRSQKNSHILIAAFDKYPSIRSAEFSA